MGKEHEIPVAGESSSAAKRTRIILMIVAGVLVCLVPLWVFLARKNNKRPIDYNNLLGCEVVNGVEEVGFYHQEHAKDGKPFRWTNGAAKLIVPIDADKPPVALELEYIAERPNGALVQCIVNGTKVFEKQSAPGKTKESFPLKDVKIDRELTIEIISETFVPSIDKKGATDKRTLGVSLRGVRLVRDFAAPSPK